LALLLLVFGKKMTVQKVTNNIVFILIKEIDIN